jgi:amino acid adenylation domain-containing protein
MDINEDQDLNSIAIIGMSVRFPGANSVTEFWDNLCAGVESIANLSISELNAEGIDSTIYKNSAFVSRAGVIENLELFDAAFFGCTPKEAELMDPQNKILLECAYEAMENAGYTAEAKDGRIGVYVGVGSSDYYINNLLSHPDLLTTNSYQINLNNEKDFTALYLSYRLNLQGPSITIATACSTSLVAIHLACKSLLTYECEMALAGAAKIAVPHKSGYLYNEGGIDSPDGHCRAFDANAKGTVIGNGAGMVLLKRLQDAIDDADHIYAVIKGSAINNDGAVKVGFTAPSIEGQTKVIEEALSLAGTDPDTIHFIEAHGTGTLLGDPIEIRALTEAFQARTPQKGFCYVGSVKTNIGHTDVAAGVAGLIKASLAIKNNIIPPSLHFQNPNPKIDFLNSPFLVNTKLQAWPNSSYPRRAGVSSFGLGGTNAHVVLEQAPTGLKTSAAREIQLFLFSAKTQPALNTIIHNFQEYLCANSDETLPDIAYTLQMGRNHYPFRGMAISRSSNPNDLLNVLKTDVKFSEINPERSQALVFLFADAMNSPFNLTLNLYLNEKLFKKSITKSARILTTYLQQDILTILYPDKKDIPQAELLLKQPHIIDCITFVVQYSLTELWREWGVEPHYAIGYGVSEYVSACIAGVFNLEDALRLLSQPVKFRKLSLKNIKFNPPTIPFISTVTGTWIEKSDAINPEYWIKQAEAVQNTSATDNIIDNLLSKTQITLLNFGFNKLINHLHHARIYHVPPTDTESILTTLGQLWLNGFVINWHAYSQDEIRKRVPLPTYPFERKYYWIKPAAKKVESSSQTIKETRSNYYAPSWKSIPLIVENNLIAKNACLIFVEENDLLCSGIFDTASKIYQPIIRVYKGVSFKEIGINTFTVNPKAPDDYSFLIKTLRNNHLTIEGIIHLWSVSKTIISNTSIEFFNDCQTNGFYSLLFLTQALSSFYNSNTIKMLIVSNHLHQVLGSETTYPEQALLVAACKVISQEHINIRCSSIDLPLQNNNASKTAAAIINELDSHLLHRSIAYREQKRWVEHYEPITFPPAHLPFLRKNGVYLITGGLGKIGLLIAEYFSQITKVNIILLSRSNFPEKSLWNLIKDEASLHKIQQFKKIENFGSNIYVVKADVTNAEEMKQVFLWLDEKFNHLDGVVHAAGDLSENLLKPIVKLSKQDCEDALKAKTYGLYILEDLLKHRKLDFCLLMSSLSAVLGGMKFYSYAAANLFMDKFAQSRNDGDNQFNWTAVNWDGWQLDNAIDSNYSGQLLTAKDGLSALHTILGNCSLDQAIVTKEDLNVEVSKWLNLSSLISEVQIQKEIDAINTPATIQSTLKQMWIELLGVNNINLKDDFFALGGDSLLAIQLASRISQQFGISLPVEDLFEYTTIAALANKISLAIKPPDNNKEITVEEVLQKYWKDLLGISNIDFEDNFFELGGDSLLATQLSARIKDNFRIDISFDVFYEHQTIKTLADEIKAMLNQKNPVKKLPSLKPVERKEEIPLSFAQQRLWLLDKILEVKNAYNVILGWKLSGTLNTQGLVKAIDTLLNRHEVLRTTFIETNSNPMQVISPSAIFCIQQLDLTNLTLSQQNEALRFHISQENNTAFNLSVGPLFKAKLIKNNSNEHILLVSLHHILIDGWSLLIFEKELSHYYNLYISKGTDTLAALPIQYADYAIWQRNSFDTEIINKQLNYWQTQLKDIPDVLVMPSDRPRPKLASYQGAVHITSLPPQLLVDLTKLSQQQGATLFMTLLAAFYTLLLRYSGQTDIVIGAPIANRRYVEIENLIGFFANTLALRVTGSMSTSFTALLAAVKTMTLGAYEHQDIPFEQIVDHLQIKRDLSRNPVFQVMLSFQKLQDNAMQLQGLNVKHLELNYQIAKFDLTLWVHEGHEDAEGLRLGFEYATDLYDAATIERMAEHYIVLLNSIISQPEMALGELPLLTAKEKQTLLVDWNATAANIDTHCVYQLFETQVQQHPDAIALYYENQVLTFGELNTRANQLAHYLHSRGVKPDSLVAVCLNRTPDLLVGLLATMKAGGAYVPLDPAYPLKRLHYIVEDAKAHWLLTETSLVSLFPDYAYERILIDTLGNDVLLQSDNPAPLATKNHLAYVIYTSGSTGKPKGVMIEHGNLLNFMHSMSGLLDIKKADRFIALTSVSFDISGLEIYLPLINGASLVLVDKVTMNDGLRLRQAIENQNVTVIQATPASWQLLLGSGWKGRENVKVLCGGEELSQTLARQLLNECEEITNLYGPTETTIWSTMAKVTPASGVHLGRAIANTQIYVLDDKLNPVPIGVAGEIYIGGSGVGRGYWNRADLTAERFMNNPFASGRLYKTGDQGRFLADGCLQYLGRLDQQVKIRGFRIEMGEIETLLQGYSGITAAVVIVNEGMHEEKELVAYLVGAEQVPLKELLAYLRSRLPDYMVPAHFVNTPALPLTPNGKLDRKALPKLVRDARINTEKYMAPKTAIEKQLCAIWASVLNVEKVGLQDNFFDLGGNSILAMKLIFKLRQELHFNIQITLIFEFPNLINFLEAIETENLQAQHIPLMMRLLQ